MKLLVNLSAVLFVAAILAVTGCGGPETLPEGKSPDPTSGMGPGGMPKPPPGMDVKVPTPGTVGAPGTPGTTPTPP